MPEKGLPTLRAGRPQRENNACLCDRGRRNKNLRKRLKMLVFAGEVWYTSFRMNVLLSHGAAARQSGLLPDERKRLQVIAE